MEALRSRDLVVLLEVIADIGATDNLTDLRTAIPAHLAALVGCDVASYNEVGPAQPGTERLEVHVEALPTEMLDDRPMLERFAAHLHQNPLLEHFQRTGDSATLRMSDHISRRRLHALELYDEVYRRLVENSSPPRCRSRAASSV